MTRAPKEAGSPAGDSNGLDPGETGRSDDSGRPEWLALADPEGPIDLLRLFPEVSIRVEPSSAPFVQALFGGRATFAILVAPPAGAGDLERVGAWLDGHRRRAVLLSGHQAAATRLHALDLGFADAIDLSADPMEVVGRLSIAGRQTLGRTRAAGRMPVGEDAELDLQARVVWRDGEPLSLRPKEFELLEFLVGHPGRAFSRRDLLRHIWQEDSGNERVVDVYVYWLRTKLEADPGRPIHLVTLRGAGYRFDPPRPPNVNAAPTRR